MEDSLSLLEDEFLPEAKEEDPLIEAFDDSLSIEKQSIELVSDNLLEDGDLDTPNSSEVKKTRTIRVLGESASSGSSTPSATPSPCNSRTNR